jgi:uncharacterized membrane protein
MEVQPAARPATPVLRERAYRVNTIDFLRGLVMIIMALDHTRDYFHDDAMINDPLNLQTTTPWLFLTRWITHFCAPIFVFLSGTSIYLQSLRKSKKELGIFLLKRGLWLVLLEITLVTFGITFDIYFSFFFLQVIWSIGISMVILAALIRLPFKFILAIGLLIVLGHNLLDYWEASQKGNFPAWYVLLHRQAFIPLWDGHVLGILYPFLPWTGLMFLGYCLGSLYRKEVDERKRSRTIAMLGVGAIALFILLRLPNLYGNPGDWSPQKNVILSVLSFINTQKYPPSLQFMCMTIGPALLFLAMAGRLRGWLADAITVYGRVPMFYYLLHFYLLHLVAAVVFLINGHPLAHGIHGLPNAAGFPFHFLVPGEGIGLGGVYLVWLAVVIALYPLCRWYSNYKQRHKKWWLSYL